MVSCNTLSRELSLIMLIYIVSRYAVLDGIFWKSHWESKKCERSFGMALKTQVLKGRIFVSSGKYICNKLLAQRGKRLSTHCKELYGPLIKHSVHAAAMWSFFWQTWLLKVFCGTILEIVRNFPWIIHLTAGDAAVRNSSSGRKEIKMGWENNNNKPRKQAKWKEFVWAKVVRSAEMC